MKKNRTGSRGLSHPAIPATKSLAAQLKGTETNAQECLQNPSSLASRFDYVID